MIFKKYCTCILQLRWIHWFDLIVFFGSFTFSVYKVMSSMNLDNFIFSFYLDSFFLFFIILFLDCLILSALKWIPLSSILNHFFWAIRCNLIDDPLYDICCFFLAVYKINFFSLNSLIMICPSTDLF